MFGKAVFKEKFKIKSIFDQSRFKLFKTVFKIQNGLKYFGNWDLVSTIDPGFCRYNCIQWRTPLDAAWSGWARPQNEPGDPGAVVEHPGLNPNCDFHRYCKEPASMILFFSIAANTLPATVRIQIGL